MASKAPSKRMLYLGLTYNWMALSLNASHAAIVKTQGKRVEYRTVYGESDAKFWKNSIGIFKKAGSWEVKTKEDLDFVRFQHQLTGLPQSVLSYFDFQYIEEVTGNEEHDLEEIYNCVNRTQTTTTGDFKYWRSGTKITVPKREKGVAAKDRTRTFRIVYGLEPKLVINEPLLYADRYDMLYSKYMPDSARDKLISLHKKTDADVVFEHVYGNDDEKINAFLKKHRIDSELSDGPGIFLGDDLQQIKERIDTYKCHPTANLGPVYYDGRSVQKGGHYATYSKRKNESRPKDCPWNQSDWPATNAWATMRTEHETMYKALELTLFESEGKEYR